MSPWSDICSDLDSASRAVIPIAPLKHEIKDAREKEKQQQDKSYKTGSASFPSGRPLIAALRVWANNVAGPNRL